MTDSDQDDPEPGREVAMTEDPRERVVSGRFCKLA
jgi:hypothetical protein